MINLTNRLYAWFVAFGVKGKQKNQNISLKHKSTMTNIAPQKIDAEREHLYSSIGKNKQFTRRGAIKAFAKIDIKK
jgi:hypothetical protein